MSKLLFILKRREDYSAIIHNNVGLSTGLYNSAKFMDDMMKGMGIDSELEVAIDNNCIDRLVNKHKPTNVIIEALWVVPSKFSVLQKLHPNVTWIVRLHSEMPFMSGEGIAMDWIVEYSKFKNVLVACNAPRMTREVAMIIGDAKTIYLPNYYPQDYVTKEFDKNKEYIDVGCFGAIRPLKNQLLQAFAALHFAERIGKKLRFHVNVGRIEMNGDPVKNNIRTLFEQLADTGHQLINHQWTPREEFLKLCATMDIGLQCNFSETFNIVSADLISQGVPIVGSKEIPWSSFISNADPNDSTDISDMLVFTYCFPQLNVKLNQRNLRKYTDKTKKIWYKYFN